MKACLVWTYNQQWQPLKGNLPENTKLCEEEEHESGWRRGGHKQSWNDNINEWTNAGFTLVYVAEDRLLMLTSWLLNDPWPGSYNVCVSERVLLQIRLPLSLLIGDPFFLCNRKIHVSEIHSNVMHACQKGSRPFKKTEVLYCFVISICRWFLVKSGKLHNLHQ